MVVPSVLGHAPAFIVMNGLVIEGPASQDGADPDQSMRHFHTPCRCSPPHPVSILDNPRGGSMRFLFCPRFRRYRRVPDSPDTSESSYQLSQIGSSVSSYGPPEGAQFNHFQLRSLGTTILTKTGISSATDPPALFVYHSGSNAGLAGRLRRQFSREIEDFHARPRHPENGHKNSLFSFSSKCSTHNQGHITSHDVGSGLMSERGYDSDAQFISTPKQTVHSTQYPTIRLRDRMNTSPYPQPYHEIDPEPVRDQNTGLMTEIRSAPNEPHFYHMDTRVSQPSWHQQDHQQRPSPAFCEPSSFHNIDIGSPRTMTMSPCTNVVRVFPQERVALTSTPRPQEMHRPHPYPGLPRAIMPIPGCEDNTSQYHNHGHEPGRPGYPSPTLQPQAYTSSTDSLIGPSTQISVRKRCQRPLRDFPTENPSTHLGDIEISKALTSPSASPHIKPQVFSHRDSSPETWSANRWRALASSAPDASEPKREVHPKVYSPSHTRKSSFSSPPNGHLEPGQSQNPALYAPPRNPGFATPEIHGAAQPEVLSNHQEETPVSDNHMFNNKADGHRSKFIEQFESDRSAVSNGRDSQSDIVKDPSAPRRISVGWMSGGRRIGYGYTLVPPDDPNEGEDLGQGGPQTLRPYVSKITPSGINRKTPPGKGNKPNTMWKKHANKGSANLGESNFDMSSILHRLNLQRWPRANSSAKLGTLSDANSCGSTFSLQGIAKRRRNEDKIESNTDSKNPWGFCSWVNPDHAWCGQQGPQKDHVPSTQSAEERLAEKLTTLRRKGTVWTNIHGRKVSAIARELEKRAVAKLATSTEQFPVIQRTATRVLRVKSRDGQVKRGKVHHDTAIFAVAGSDRHIQEAHSSRQDIRGLEHEQTKSSRGISSDSTSDWDSTSRLG